MWYLFAFILGAGVVAVGFAFVQYLVIRAVAPTLGYRFNRYVLETKIFPAGDFEQGRVIRRCFFPARALVKFYDAQFNEVTEAAKPGRYGAVVTMKLNWGFTHHAFITLYRTPEKVFWWNGPMTLDAQFPPNTGIDPVVFSKQRDNVSRALRDGVTDSDRGTPTLAILLAGLSELSPNDPPTVDRLGVFNRDAAWWHELRKRIGLQQHYPYLVDLPEGYEHDPGLRWPLVVYLHSLSQNGRDLNAVRACALPAVIAGGLKLPAVVISPQAPWHEGWNPQVLDTLLKEVEAKYRIDPDRVYLTGVSSGACGTWRMALEYPGRFAAIVPVSGEHDPNDVESLAKIPVWAFTGEHDQVIPANHIRRLVEAIRKAGGHPHLTVYPDHAHDAEFTVYKTDALYQWIFAQKRGQPEVLTSGLPEA